MTQHFFISDHHFGHRNILTFTRGDGSPLRSGFSSIEEMDEAMVAAWNSVVSPNDIVTYLGDFCMPRRSLSILDRLKGRMRWVLGNHDHWRPEEMLRGPVKSLHGMLTFDGLGWVCTHAPTHPSQLGEKGRWKLNVHGHLHHKEVLTPVRKFKHDTRAFLDDDGNVETETMETEMPREPDKRYFNVSVERLDSYRPIEVEEIKYALATSS